MKNYNPFLLIALLMLIGIKSYEQTNFKWDVIIDSLDDNQNQLYSKTKLFIGETWKDSKTVIQNDDKEGGIVMVRGLYVNTSSKFTNIMSVEFPYSIKFLMKDKKCRIIIENVFCQSVTVGNTAWSPMPVAEEYPSEEGYVKTGVGKTKYKEIMNSLKQELQVIVDSYILNMKKPIINNPDW